MGHSILHDLKNYIEHVGTMPAFLESHGYLLSTDISTSHYSVKAVKDNQRNILFHDFEFIPKQEDFSLKLLFPHFSDKENKQLLSVLKFLKDLFPVTKEVKPKNSIRINRDYFVFLNDLIDVTFKVDISLSLFISSNGDQRTKIPLAEGEIISFDFMYKKIIDIVSFNFQESVSSVGFFNIENGILTNEHVKILQMKNF